MKLPIQAAAVDRRSGIGRSGQGIGPSGCNVWDWIKCAGAVAGCVVSCAAGPVACVACFAAAGVPSCIDCIGHH